MTLDTLAVGNRARVSSIEGERRLRRRLLELGLVPGTEVRVLRRAPLGDPLELHVRGGRLSLRKADAARIAVSPS
jgi:ferrous iron transport protein A